MSQIITFLGSDPQARLAIAIASAKKLARLGSRVLLAGQDPGPALGLLLDSPLGPDPLEIEPNLTAVSLQATRLLAASWEQVKSLEAQYLRSPALKSVFGQELGVLPGMDSALVLNALREYDKSGQYDTIIFAGTGDIHSLRMFGIAEVLSWYIRRFQQVFLESDIGKALSPFIQPISSAVLNVTWTPDSLAKEPTDRANQLLEDGKAALANPERVVAYLVTSSETVAMATAKYLWGSAQQVGLSVGGVLLQGEVSGAVSAEFAPLSITTFPAELEAAIASLPDLRQVSGIPKPLVVDVAARQVKVFLPGFTKKQVKLTQYGPEITIEAGDQRRNLTLPSALAGQSVKGAKFQDGYLIISL